MSLLHIPRTHPINKEILKIQESLFAPSNIIIPTSAHTVYPWYKSSHHIIGFIIAHTIQTQAEILSLGIKKSHQNAQEGTHMLTHFLHHLHADNITTCTLETPHTNTPALRLYKTCGFTQQGIRSAYYKDGQDAVILSCHIPSFLR